MWELRIPEVGTERYWGLCMVFKAPDPQLEKQCILLAPNLHPPQLRDVYGSPSHSIISTPLTMEIWGERWGREGSSATVAVDKQF